MDSGQFEFGAYRLDAQSGMLFRDGDHVALPPKVAELLVALVQAAGRVLTREVLVQRLWPDTVVEEGSLTSHISLLRKALGEGPKAQDFIETLPKRGYRFVASVKRLASGAHDSSVERTMLVVLPFENLSPEYLMAMGRTREAVGRVEHGWELDPLNSVINASVGMIRYLAHDYDGALVVLRRGLEIDPTHYVSYLRTGLVCLQKNLLNEAIDAMRQAVTHSGGSTEALAGLAQALTDTKAVPTVKEGNDHE